VIDHLAARLDAALEEHDFSGVVEIREAGVVRYARARGFADRTHRVPNALETRFGTASGTKFLTALGIGRLVAAGKLTLETRLRDALPIVFPNYAPEITVRHLLSHTSGVPDYFDEEKHGDFDNVDLGVPNTRLRELRDYLPLFPDEPMKFVPGTAFSYSNGGYILLGLLVEELSGNGFREFVTREILEPVGMERSGFFALNRLPEGTATGYITEEDGWRTNVYTLPIVGSSDGGVFMTLADLDRLWTAFWSGAILDPAMVEAFATPQVKAASEGPDLWYGLGLWIREAADRPRQIYITGCDAGVSFKSLVDRRADRQVTVLSNTTDGAWPILRAIEGFETATS